MLYSVKMRSAQGGAHELGGRLKMRSAQGGAHELGGRHISGAERILPGDQLDYAVLTMLRRAREHERGCADFISLKVEEIKPQEIIYKPLLAFSTCKAATAAEGHRAAIGCH